MALLHSLFSSSIDAAGRLKHLLIASYGHGPWAMGLGDMCTNAGLDTLHLHINARSCKKRCTVAQVKGTVSGVQKRVLLGRLSKALKGSVSDAMYKRGMAVGVKMEDSEITLAQAEELWRPILRAIHLRKKKREVLNLYKRLYIMVERRAPKTLELDSFVWKTNAMHSGRKSVSL